MTDPAMHLPTVLVSSVVRSTHQGESHGGLYLLDLASGARRQVVDWNTSEISFEGRGYDRGLRGIAFHNGEVWVAATNKLLVYNRAFTLQRTFTNPYLGHCHEIARYGGRLYVTSTGFDSVLEFDLETERFTRGWSIRGKHRGGDRVRLDCRPFDPNGEAGPTSGDTVHINNVHADDTGIFVGALRLPVLLRIGRGAPQPVANLPVKTHNAHPFAGGLILVNTWYERAEHRTTKGALRMTYPLPRYPEAELINGHLPRDHAFQAFGRGLCVYDAGGRQVLAVGSSPATVGVFDVATGERLVQWNLTMDVRNAVHGLAVWPYPVPDLLPAPADQNRNADARQQAAAL